MLSSSEPATLCELGLEDGGKCFVEVQSVREEGQVKSLDLRVIEGVSVWSGSVSKTDKPAKKKGADDSVWLGQIFEALTAPSSEYLFSFEAASQKLVIKQDLGKAKSKIAEIRVSIGSSDEKGIRELLLNVVASQLALNDKNEKLEMQNRKLAMERDEFKKIGEEATSGKQRDLDELHEDFLPLLNTKKQKVDALEAEVKRLKRSGASSVKTEDAGTDEEDDEAEVELKTEAGMEDYSDDGSDGDGEASRSRGGVHDDDSGDETENDVVDDDRDIYNMGTFTTSETLLNNQFADSDDDDGPRQKGKGKGEGKGKGKESKVKVEVDSDDGLLNGGGGSSSASSSSSSYRRKRKPVKAPPAAKPAKRVKIERQDSGTRTNSSKVADEADPTQEESECSYDDLLG
jgi:hypothetical protein